MSDVSPTAPAPAPTAPAQASYLPSQAVSQDRKRTLYSGAVQALVIFTVALAEYVLLAGEAVMAHTGMAPERAITASAAVAGAIVLVGSVVASRLARRIAMLEMTIGWLLVSAPVIAVIGGIYMEKLPPEWAGRLPADLLYLTTLLGPNPFSGLILGAHGIFILQLLGSTAGYLALGGGSLDLRIGFEAHVARQHLRLTGRKVALVFALGVISPVLLLVWPVTLIGLTIADGLATSGARRRVLEQLMPYIAILGVSIGVCALVTVLSVMSGFEVDLKRKILGTNAHGVVMRYGDFTEYQEAARKVRAVRGVKGVSPFVLNEVMLTSEQNLAGVLIKGIDPESVGQVTELPENIADKEGAGKLEYLQHPDLIPNAQSSHAELDQMLQELRNATGEPRKIDDEETKRKAAAAALPGIIVGRELARTLRVYVGDRISVVSPVGGELGPTGPMPKSRPFRVAAIFKSGMYEYDSKFAYIALDSAQKFFGTGNVVNGLELKVDDIDNIKPINRKIMETLDGYPFHTRDWGEMNHNLFAALRLEKLAMAIMLTFIVLVACINILSTLVVFALQKAKEVAILKSMGARDTGIMKIFVIEGLIIGAIGTILGLIQGYGCCWFVEKFGITLDPEVYYIDKLPVKLDPGQFLAVALTALMLSYLATLFPSLNASRLRPVEGLKTE